MHQVLVLATALLALAAATPAFAQSLDDLLDEDAFLRGLIDLELPELLEEYVRTHPAADPVRLVSYQIAGERLRLRQAESSVVRLAAIERTLTLRDSLIDGHPDHPQRVTWLADQAADLFFEMLPVEAAGQATLFGLPSAVQRERAIRVAREMNRLTAQAEHEVEGAILAIESTPGYRDSEPLQLKRRTLADRERDLRIPFLRGVAAFLHSELGEETRSRQRGLREIAVSSLSTLVGRLDGDLAIDARVYGGLAMTRLGRHDEAEVMLSPAAVAEAASTSGRFAIQMARALHLGLAGGPLPALSELDTVEREYGGADRLYYRVLIADRRFLLRLQMAEGREDGAAYAYRAYLDLLAPAPGIPHETLQSIVFERLERRAIADDELAALPAIVTVARADRLAGDGKTRERAIELLESVLARSDLDPRETTAARYGLGAALHRSGRPLAAADQLKRLAHDHPRDPKAAPAIELAAGMAARHHQADPRDAEGRAVLRETLEVMMTRFPELPTIDRWRYQAGRLAMLEHEAQAAARHFAAISPRADHGVDAIFMRVTALRAALERVGNEDDRRRLLGEVIAAAEAATPALSKASRLAEGQRRRDIRYYLLQMQVFTAEARLRRGEPDAALAVLDGFEEQPELEDAVLAAALRVRIDAYRTLGRADDVQQQLERILSAAPAQAPVIIDTILASGLPAIERLLDEGREVEARTLAERELVPLAALLEQAIAVLGTAGPDLDPMLARAADAYRLGGRFGHGLRLYDEIVPRHESEVAVLFGRAECLYGLASDRDAEAITVFKRVVAAGPTVGHRHYWQSQLRVLQILDRVGRNTQKIGPRIKRLRMQDPALGGKRFERGFLRLESKYS